MKPDRWISVRQAAQLAECPVWFMRRRLEKLNARSGGGILRSFQGRRGRGVKLWVSMEALMAELRTERDKGDAELGRLRADLESLGRRLNALSKSHRTLSRTVSENEKRQKLINRKNLAAIQSIQELAHIVAE